MKTNEDSSSTPLLPYPPEAEFLISSSYLGSVGSHKYKKLSIVFEQEVDFELNPMSSCGDIGFIFDSYQCVIKYKTVYFNTWALLCKNNMTHIATFVQCVVNLWVRGQRSSLKRFRTVHFNAWTWFWKTKLSFVYFVTV